MKRYAVLIAVGLFLAMSGAAWAQQNVPGGNTGAPAIGGGQKEDPARFQEHKAKILEHMSKRLAEIQQHQSCVQAANDPQALMACKPPKGAHGGKGCGGGGFHHGGMMRQGQGGPQTGQAAGPAPGVEDGSQ